MTPQDVKTYMLYTDAIGEGEIVSRSIMARRMKVNTTTAKYHLERAVEAGEINRAWGSIGNQRGWVYALPSTMPKLTSEK